MTQASVRGDSHKVRVRPPQRLLQSGQRRALGRIVVILVALVPLFIATVAAVAAKYLDGDPFNPEPLVFSLFGWDIVTIDAAPRMDLLILAGITLVLVSAGSVALEGISTLRVLYPTRNQLPYMLKATPEGVDPRVIVVLPAHNEADNLPRTIPALHNQRRPPDRIIVAADNCTDDTKEIATALGAEVVETKDNADRKAGALNQVLREILPTLTRDDIILVADADTVLSGEFIENGLEAFEHDIGIDAVGGLFYGEAGSRLIGQLQRNEYDRYQLQVSQRRGRVFVLTGTASMFKAEALADIAQARGDLIPGRPGDIYDASAITEDNELTLALKSLGCRMTSPKGCVVETEIMPSWRTLWIQRKRWQSGALENLGSYGFTTATVRYWGQQFGLAYGVVALFSAYVLVTISLLAANRWQWPAFWVGVTLLFAVERTLSVYRGGWRAMLLAAPLIFEIAYAFFLQAVFISSLSDIARGKKQRWGHVQGKGSEKES